MSLRSAFVLAPAVAVCTVAAPALAQNICAERNRVVDQFRAEFNESPTAVGLVSQDTLLEVLTSEKGTWTIIITRPNGASCLVASGVAWQTLGTQAGYRSAETAAPKRLVAAESVQPID